MSFVKDRPILSGSQIAKFILASMPYGYQIRTIVFPLTAAEEARISL